MVHLRFLTPEDWRLWRKLRLEALCEAPQAFRANLAYWQSEGDTEQRWRDRLASVELNVIADFDDRHAGMVSGFSHQNGVELISLWVAPFARGHGIGDRLVDVVVHWAQKQGSPKVFLSVRADNQPAIDLYRRRGFTDGGPNPDAPAGLERLMVHTL